MNVVQHPKTSKKERVIALRKRGLSFSEIIKIIPVPKSTLSLWLRRVKIPDAQKKILEKRKIQAIMRYSQQKKRERIASAKKIFYSAAGDIKEISKKEFWLMGVMLYWALGWKEKEKKPNLGVRFSSSNPPLMKLFITWLQEIGGLRKDEMYFDIFIGENKKYAREELIHYWSKNTGIPASFFSHIYFQKNKSGGRGKKNNYGMLRLRVASSSMLCRQISGWIEGIKKHYWLES